QAIWRQLRRSPLPAKADRAAEFAIPHPEPETRQPGNLRAIRERNGRTFCIRIRQALEKARGIVCNHLQFLGGGGVPRVIWRPTSAKRVRIAEDIWQRWAH